MYYLPEDVAPLNIKASDFAADNGCFWPNFNMSEFQKLMNELEVDSSDKMNKMSSGQLKKTYIAFALACNVKYLFMDEPTNALDIPSKSQFRMVISEYAEKGSVIVISTHQVRDLEDIINHILILDKQDVLLNANIEEISKKLYFDYSNELKDDAIYSELIPGGRIQICPNVDGRESKVNTEVLFNMMHHDREVTRNVF